MRDRLQQELKSVAEKEQLALLNLTNSGNSLLTKESSLCKEEVQAFIKIAEEALQVAHLYKVVEVSYKKRKGTWEVFSPESLHIKKRAHNCTFSMNKRDSTSY